jgi:ubiquinone/menaquinone biosynthesis C-methylase UbiE
VRLKILNTRLSAEVRRIAVNATVDQPQNQFHVISDLNWLRYERQIESLFQPTSEGGKLLDMGCGWGFTSAILAASNSGLEVTGLDIEQMVSWPYLEKYGARYLVYDSKNNPFPDNEFDYCTTFGVLEHTEDDVIFLNEIRRVLKPGGILFIFNLPSTYALFERAAIIFGIRSHDRTYTAAKIRSLTKSTGFTIDSMYRELFLPAQLARINPRIADIYNRHAVTVDKIDVRLNKMCDLLSQSYAVQARKLM